MRFVAERSESYVRIFFHAFSVLCVVVLQVKRLQQSLQDETNLRAVLENALEHAAVALSDISYLPNNVYLPLLSLFFFPTAFMDVSEIY